MKRSSFNDGEWTAAKFRSFVTGALRTATRRWPPKYKALKEAYIGRQTNKKTGKTRISSRGVNTSGALKLLIRFGDALAVRTRLGYQARATALVNANFNAEMDQAMVKAMASARP